MTTTYDWPTAFGVNRFELRISHNTKAFISPFTSSSQVMNYTGERFIASIGMVPGNSVIRGASVEAFLDRMSGPANRVRLWNMRRPQPVGTLSGSPTNISTIAVGARSAFIQTSAGLTLLAGDHIGIANGQNVRIMADAVANGSGVMAIEFQPRARTEVAIGGAITWNRPTFDAMLKTDGAPITWRPGMYEETSLEFIEAI